MKPPILILNYKDLFNLSINRKRKKKRKNINIKKLSIIIKVTKNPMIFLSFNRMQCAQSVTSKWMVNAIQHVRHARKVFIQNVSKFGQDINKIQNYLLLALCADHNSKILWLLSSKIYKNGRLAFKPTKELFAEVVESKISKDSSTNVFFVVDMIYANCAFKEISIFSMKGLL